MIKFFLLVCTTFVLNCAFAGNTTIDKKNSSVIVLNKDSKKNDPCCATATRSATVSGIDCEGFRFSITQSYTNTSCEEGGNCQAAYDRAASFALASAITLATIAATLISANC